MAHVFDIDPLAIAGTPLERNALMAQRLAKRQALWDAGQSPYANDFSPTHTAVQALRWFASDPLHLQSFVATELGAAVDNPPLQTSDHPSVQSPRVRMAGRALAINVKGKVAFVRVLDRSAAEVPSVRAHENVLRELIGLPPRDAQTPTFQFYFSRDDDPATFDRLFKPTEGASWNGPLCDVGDIIGGQGLWFRTRTGEQSLWLKPDPTGPALRILTKSVRPLPDKFHGLADKETRLRQRYVDLTMNQDVREIFRKRSQVLRGVRQFLDDRDYVEVETPMMHTSLGGAAARPFRTHHNALDMPLYLRIAPELHLKRLVVGGIERVYEINRNFRNEGLSQRHNPEFTMLEFYRAYATFRDLMDEVETLISQLALQVCGATQVTWGSNADGSPRVIELAAPYARVRIRDGLRQWAQLAEAALDDEPSLRKRALELGVHLDAHATLGKIQVELFEAVAEPHLIAPTFVWEYPAETSPLARSNDANPAVVDRFELFIGGIEISNAFSELNDPVDQYQRFAQQLDQRAKGDEETMDLDVDYVRALEYGMPPAAGCGIGIDRLVMLLSGAESIREVILFPHLRPETGTAGQIADAAALIPPLAASNQPDPL